MPESDDIRLRGRVQSSRQPQQRAKTTRVKNVDVGGLAVQASKKLTEIEKVKLKAEDLAISDFENRLRRESFISQTRVANSRGTKAYESGATELKRLQDLKDGLVEQLPSSLREKARVRFGSALLPFEKLSLLHVSKENQAHSDSVLAETVKLDATEALSNIGSPDFDKSLERVKKSAMKAAQERGRGNLAEVDGLQAVGDTLIGAMKTASSQGSNDMVSSIFEQHKDKFVTPKQRVEAESILAKAKDNEAIIKASALVEEAFTLFDNGDDIERYLRQEAPNSEVFKDSLPIMRSKLVRLDKEKKARREKEVASAVEFVNGGGELTKALQMVSTLDKDRVRKAYKNRVEGKTIASDPSKVNQLIKLMNEDPDVFKDRAVTNLNAMRGVELSDVDFTRFKGYQDSLNNLSVNQSDRFKNSTPKSVLDLINLVASDRSLETSSTFKLTAYDIFDELKEKYIKENNNNLTEFRREFKDKLFAQRFIRTDENLPIKKSSVLESLRAGEPVAGLSERSQGLFSTDDLDDDDRDRIEEALQKQLGRRATSQELNEAVKRVLIRKLRLERFTP